MKKFITLILSICLIISMTACQSSSQKTTKKSTNSSASSQTQKETTSPNTSAATQPKNENTNAPKPAEKRTDCDFRNAKWGDTMADVKNYELEIEDYLVVSDSQLGGEASVAGYSTYVVFDFDNDSLCRGTYVFNLKYSNAGQYIPVYNTLKNNLTEKYGNPESDSIIPLADELTIEMAGEATALKLGYVQYEALWETSRTKIRLLMASENYRVTLGIIYFDKNYVDSSDNGL